MISIFEEILFVMAVVGIIYISFIWGKKKSLTEEIKENRKKYFTRIIK